MWSEMISDLRKTFFFLATEQNNRRLKYDFKMRMNSRGVSLTHPIMFASDVLILRLYDYLMKHVEEFILLSIKDTDTSFRLLV